MSPMIAWLTPPSARPRRPLCSTRASTSWPMLCASPQSSEAAVNTTMAKSIETAAAVEVAELAVDRHRYGHRHHVGRDHPGQQVEVGEVGRDRRQGRRRRWSGRGRWRKIDSIRPARTVRTAGGFWARSDKTAPGADGTRRQRASYCAWGRTGAGNIDPRVVFRRYSPAPTLRPALGTVPGVAPGGAAYSISS